MSLPPNMVPTVESIIPSSFPQADTPRFPAISHAGGYQLTADLINFDSDAEPEDDIYDA